mmetsp:Transcript_13964/g.25888  ORF Transcript_13964/g.25888 Transcript_13964/m.25888 type:complete len:207 (-) Transcript_13964:188-808(-)
MANRTKSRVQLLAEAEAVLNDHLDANEIDAPPLGVCEEDDEEVSLWNPCESKDAPLEKSEEVIKELQKKLSYIQWLRLQNTSRMRETMDVTRKMRQRDLKEDFGELERSERIRQICSDEFQRPLQVNRDEIEYFAQMKQKDDEMCAARKRALRREKKRHQRLVQERLALAQRNETYRLRKQAVHEEGTVYGLLDQDSAQDFPAMLN